jgi:hypothetical protein
MHAIVFMDNDSLLEFLSSEAQESPEEFLIRMEEALEQGLLTEDEVTVLVRDFMQR